LPLFLLNAQLGERKMGHDDATEYRRAVELAKANLADARERGADAIGGDALELMRGLRTVDAGGDRRQ